MTKETYKGNKREAKPGNFYCFDEITAALAHQRYIQTPKQEVLEAETNRLMSNPTIEGLGFSRDQIQTYIRTGKPITYG